MRNAKEIPEMCVYAQYCIAWPRLAAALVCDPSIRATSTEQKQCKTTFTAQQIKYIHTHASGLQFRFLLQRRRITSACEAHRYITWHAVRCRKYYYIFYYQIFSALKHIRCKIVFFFYIVATNAYFDHTQVCFELRPLFLNFAYRK